MPRIGLVLVWIGLLAPLALTARDIHVSPTGRADGDGSIGAPFGTVASALGMAGAGDRVLLERDGVFYEYDLALPSGVTLTHYGDGDEPPALHGGIVVSSWQPWPERPGVYRATLPSWVPGVRQVYVDNRFGPVARWPDAGWLHYQAGSNRSRFYDAALATHPQAAAGRWKGANVRVREWSWWFSTFLIDRNLGFDGVRTLHLAGSAVPLESPAGNGYYIDNTLEELDVPGEWYYDTAARQLYYHPPEGMNPDEMTIVASIPSQWEGVQYGAGLSPGQDAVVDGIAFRYYANEAMSIGSRAEVRNCLFENLPMNGINASWQAGGSHIHGNTFRDILNTAIWWNENPNGAGGTVIERNRMQRIGMVPGYGGGGVWKAAGVVISLARQLRFRLNHIHQTGYAGIILGRGGHFVERNVFVECMSTLNDGGAIYTNSGSNTIRENIILHTVGNTESSQRWAPLGHGIWPEFLEGFRDNVIEANTVYGSNGYGLYLPNNYVATVRDNVLMASRVAEFQLGGHENRNSGTGTINQFHTIRDNIMVQGARPFFTHHPQNVNVPLHPHAMLRFNTIQGREINYGSMRGSVYVSPRERPTTYISWTPLTQAELMETYGAWADPAPRHVIGEAYLFINDTESPQLMPLPNAVSWTDLDHAAVGNATTVAPFRSVVLLAAGGDATGLPPYFLASEAARAPDFDLWMRRWPVETRAAHPAADPDGDGKSNAVEYVMDSEPSLYDAPPLEWLPTTDSWTLQLKAREHSVFPWKLERSADLQSWETVEQSTIAPDSFAGQSHFFRLSVDIAQ